MKYNREFWIVLCILTVQILSAQQKKDEVVEIQNEKTFDLKHYKKKIIDNDPTTLTEIQKMSAYAIYPTVKHFCRRVSAPFITRLIVSFFNPFLPAPVISPTAFHGDRETCVLSPDNQWITSTVRSSQYTVHSPQWSLLLWNVISGKKQRTLEGHRDSIRQCVFTSDSQCIISASLDGTLKLWSVMTGDLLHTFSGHRKAVLSCTLSMNDQYLLSTGDDSFRLWSLQTRACYLVFQGPADFIGGPVRARFIAKDQRILSISQESTFHVWDIKSGKCMQKFKHTYHIQSYNLSNDEQVLVLGGLGTVHVWPLAEPKPTLKFEEHVGKGVNSVFFVCKDTCVVSQDSNGDVLIWRWVNGEMINRFINYNTRHTFYLEHSYFLKKQNKECIFISPRKNPYEIQVVTVEAEDVVNNGIIERVAFSPDDRIKRVLVSTDGRFLVSCNRDSTKTFCFADN